MIEGVEVVIRQPGHPDRVVRLQEGSIRLGRAEDNEIVLSDVGVSRRHSLISVSATGVSIEDLGSGNGTYYHGYRIKVQELADGDEIVIDPFVLQFRVRGQVGGTRGVTAEPGTTPARLDVVVGQGMAGSSYPIPPQGLTIGRSEDRDVVIPDPAASRHHVSIYVDTEQYTLKDMGSANGVFVNAVRVRECLLADGDLVRIGNTELRFVLYDEHAVETTTQVMGAMEGYADPRTMPPPVASGRGSWLALLMGGAMAAFAFVLAVSVVVVLVFVQFNGGLAGLNRMEVPPQPPAWQLTLPDGLASATTDVLFSEGTAAMRAGDNKLALQNFYRILNADNSNASAKKFAFAAGEHIVVDVLAQGFEARRDAMLAERKERDGLFARFEAGGRGASAAKDELAERFAHDPKVKEVLGLPASDEAKRLAKRLADAADLAASGKHAEAVPAYLEVVDSSKDPAQRKTARSGLRTARRELARQTRDPWRQAVMADALGEESAFAWDEVLRVDPLNVSAKVHLEK